MEMSKDALEFQYSLGQQNTVHEICNCTFAPGNLKLSPVLHPMPEPLHVSSLTGLIDYITTNRDKLEYATVCAHVSSPALVQLRGVLMHETMQRPVYVNAYVPESTLKFNTFLPSSEFILQLHYGFSDPDGKTDRTRLMEFMGSIREEASKITEDDGVSQSVTISAGIRRSDETRVPSPVYLAPYRTFSEVEQPVSAFVMRMKDGPLCGLWEADGGAWRNEAMQRIKQYLVENLPEEVAVLA